MFKDTCYNGNGALLENYVQSTQYLGIISCIFSECREDGEIFNLFRTRCFCFYSTFLASPQTCYRLGVHHFCGLIEQTKVYFTTPFCVKSCEYINTQCRIFNFKSRVSQRIGPIYFNSIQRLYEWDFLPLNRFVINLPSFSIETLFSVVDLSRLLFYFKRSKNFLFSPI